ncbi:hypothetical protein [Micromonospora sp. NPDC049799]|uniref:hypothetical protein n=1 Tax=Micromonospora sp. NPDC049799 TaxID=3154741 RepID=UPI0033E1D945
MTVDRDAIREQRAEQGEPSTDVSTTTVVAYTLAAVLLVGWFLFGWLVQRQGFVASVGEAAGTGFGLLLVVAVVGTVRRSRR